MLTTIMRAQRYTQKCVLHKEMNENKTGNCSDRITHRKNIQTNKQTDRQQPINTSNCSIKFLSRNRVDIDGILIEV